MRLQEEYIIGAVIGLVPIAVILIILRDNDIRCTLYLKHSITIANSISLLLEIFD